MTLVQSWMLWPDNPALSVLVLALAVMMFLYAARKPVHELLRALGGLIGGPLRLAARWLVTAAEAMKQRNRAVLLAYGRQETGQRIEREFEHLGALVRRELQGYPTLQRKLLDEITRIEEDYKKCGEVPPPPPDWVEAVTAMAAVKTGGSEMVQKILEEIKSSIASIHDRAIGEYRKSYESRHKILEGFLPFWRSVDRNMTEVNKKLSDIQESAKGVDALMAKFEAINAKTDKAEHALTVSAFTQIGRAHV